MEIKRCRYFSLILIQLFFIVLGYHLNSAINTYDIKSESLSSLLNLLVLFYSYLTLTLPILFFIRYNPDIRTRIEEDLALPLVEEKSSEQNEKSSGFLAFLVSFFQPKKSSERSLISLLLHCLGLHSCYLIWGILQEKIMTKDIDLEFVPLRRLDITNFIIFINRCFSVLTVVAIYYFLKGKTTQIDKISMKTSPQYSLPAFTNTLSSYCQYEAIKFINYPTQILSKSCKILAVMSMGILVQNKIYSKKDYGLASLISIGMAIFFIGYDFNQKESNIEGYPFFGFFLLLVYLAADAYTSNKQDALMRTYDVRPIMMILKINVWSILITLLPMIYDPKSLIKILNFLQSQPSTIVDIILTSICGSIGQLFIFSTISNFGAVNFSIIMTIRQILAIILSCVLFNHRLSLLSIMGIILVFISLAIKYKK